MNQVISIKCKTCKITNLINPNIVHGEDGDPFQLHCTYCTSEIN